LLIDDLDCRLTIDDLECGLRISNAIEHFDCALPDRQSPIANPIANRQSPIQSPILNPIGSRQSAIL
jgi:hypothetical protein